MKRISHKYRQLTRFDVRCATADDLPGTTGSTRMIQSNFLRQAFVLVVERTASSIE
jgi:hypothetical protein